MNIDLSIKYYYLINEDLGMSKGKIAAQASHVAMQLSQRYNLIGRAIVLKAPEEVLRFAKNNFRECFYIEDAGLTEVPPGSLTCVGFKLSDNVNIEWLSKLKLV